MSDSVYVIDNYVSTRPGEPYRLLPFGMVKRAGGGPAKMITPEFASRFRLPHFDPPIKLGSHDDTTPAGGHMKSLFVRNEGNPETDGLWVMPEMNDKGAKAAEGGDYKYHSPEIIWEDGAIEDATKGEWIQGPLIVGDALLHVPALGKAAALYTASTLPVEKEDNDMSIENVSVPKSLLDNLLSKFIPAPGGEPQKPTEPDNYAAQVETLKAQAAANQQRADELSAQLAAIETENAHKATVSTLAAELQNKEKFGATYVELSVATAAAEVLAGMTDEQRTWVMRNFAAMTAQINETLIATEHGSGADGDPNAGAPEAFNAVVTALAAERKIDYVTAFEAVRVEKPELFAQYVAAQKGSK